MYNHGLFAPLCVRNQHNSVKKIFFNVFKKRKRKMKLASILFSHVDM